MVTSTLVVILRSVQEPVPSQWFLNDIHRQSLEMTRRTFEYLLSPLCAVTSAKRASAITRLLLAVARIAPMLGDFTVGWDTMRRNLVTRRLQDGPRALWNQADLDLRDIYILPFSIRPAGLHVLSIVDLIRECDIDGQGGNLRVCLLSPGISGVAEASQDLGAAFLCSLIPFLDEKELESILITLSGTAERLSHLIDMVEIRLAKLRASEGATPQGSPVEMSSWRSRVRDIVQTLVQPDEVQWMEDGDALPDAQYISRALNEVEERFMR